MRCEVSLHATWPGRKDRESERLRDSPRAGSLRRLKRIGWGFVDQGESSATTFILTTAGARLVGPHGLGLIAIGFSAYMVVLGLQRALVTQPLVVGTSAGSPNLRMTALRGAITVTLVGGGAAALVFAMVGLTGGGPGREALLFFAPFILWPLVQEVWRVAFFRDGRGSAAAANDLAWLVVIVTGTTLCLLIHVDSVWGAVTPWGLGALAATAGGFLQNRLRPLRAVAAFRMWRRDFLPFGRWLAGASVAYSIGTQLSIVLIAVLLNPAALGGLRAVQTVFGPLTLLAPALTLPVLPALTRRVRSSEADARRLTLQVSALLVLTATLYVGVTALLRESILSGLFGPMFLRYQDLIAPLALQQLTISVNVGFALLLQARSRGRAIFYLNLASVPLNLAAVVIGSTISLTGVAWALFVAGIVILVPTGIYAWRPGRDANEETRARERGRLVYE